MLRRRLPVHRALPIVTTNTPAPDTKHMVLLSAHPTVSSLKDVFQIKELCLCESRNLIYAPICMRRNKRIIGETGSRLVDRLCKNIMNIYNKIFFQGLSNQPFLRSFKPISFCFTIPSHLGAKDISVTVLKSCCGQI